MIRRFLSCYIAAPAGTNLATLREVLAARGIAVLVPDLSSAVAGPDTAVTQAISRADLVIGVLTAQRRSQWVLFELGQAVALNKQVVVFAPPKSDLLPTDLKRFLVLRISLRNREAIEFALDQVLAAPEQQRKSATAPLPEGRRLGTQVDVLLPAFEEAIARREGRRFEELIASALRSSGIDVIAEASNDRGFDLAVWSDALHPFVGNPLLIEAKTSLPHANDVKAALQQCARNASAAGAMWSLLIYGDGPDRKDDTWASTAPTVLAISAVDLMREMRDRSFVELIQNLRNRRVHGGVGS